jgi:S1-C subfamily serine protease
MRGQTLSGVALLGLAVVLSSCGSGEPKATSTQQARPKPKHRSFADEVALVRTGIVRIENTTCDGEDVGTGFLVAPRLVATVEHVIDGGVQITLKQNGKVVAHGTVIGLDSARDLALVRTDKPVLGYRFKLAARAPRLGEDVAAIGFPLALPLTVTRGSVSGMDRTIPIDGLKRRNLVQTDAAVNPGNSGGPLITDSGTVVGLVDLGTSEANGLAFAVSAQVAKPLLQAWQTAPQPAAAATCGSQAPPSAQAVPPTSGGTSTSSSSAQTYPGVDFNILYPAGFVVTAAEVNKGTYYDTTIQESNYLIRVDENPNGATGDIDADSAAVIDGLRREAGYQEISLEHVSFESYDSLRWEFEVPEHGVLLHKIDTFFVGDTGAEWAILTEAPASQWDQASPAFDAIANSFTETH